jgi:hypothetical protein
MITGKIWTKSELDAELASFDWSVIDALSDAEIEARAKADPDAWTPTSAEYNKLLTTYAENKAQKVAA